VPGASLCRRRGQAPHLTLILSRAQEPLPGANAFVHRGRQIAHYPRRTRYAPGAAPPAALAAPGGGGGGYDAPGAPGGASAPAPAGALGAPAMRNTTPQARMGRALPHMGRCVEFLGICAVTAQNALGSAPGPSVRWPAALKIVSNAGG